MHIEKVLENVLIPDLSEGFVWVAPYQKDGCEITDYWDEPGLYSLSRIKVEQQGIYHQERFAFLTIVEGEGRVNEVAVSKGNNLGARRNRAVRAFRNLRYVFSEL